MPRTARKRDKKRPHHLLSRSIPEQNLFREDKDKDYYISLMKTASQVYRITIIAYCLMDNHVHILVHPNGGDISKFMKNINNTYAKYYNRTYDRRGHLYEGRFKNIIIKDEVQLIRTSTYIHNNPKDLLGSRYESVEEYPYSSLRDYLKPRHGGELSDPSLVYRFMSGKGSQVRNHYRILMRYQSQNDKAFEEKLVEAFKAGEYETEKVQVTREMTPKKILQVLRGLIGQKEISLPVSKYRREATVYKCLAAICLRIFGDMTVAEVQEIFRGYTASAISQLSKTGYDIMEEKGLFMPMSELLN